MAELELRIGLHIFGFCCTGFSWKIFDIDEKGFVYSKCGNAECQNRHVFFPSEIAALKESLMQKTFWQAAKWAGKL